MEQAGAIPYRIVEGHLEFLCITSSSGRWIFPKGMIDPGDDAAKTAANESYEEAGILGEVEQCIGSYSYEKYGGDLVVSMFLLKYQRDADPWLEEGHRQRRWLSKERALEILSKESLKELLLNAHEQLTGKQ
jgi:8-oxo-dGTP pyrophosphatase MutT (NUDIX family)